MATTKPETTKTPAAKKPAVPVVNRLTEQMKRAAMGGKLSAEELDKIANLAGALKTFLAA